MKLEKRLMKNLGIRGIYHTKNKTIVVLNDGSRGEATRSSEDIQDVFIGISVAYTAAKAKMSKKLIKLATEKL